jgi:hypothetical protein
MTALAEASNGACYAERTKVRNYGRNPDVISRCDVRSSPADGASGVELNPAADLKYLAPFVEKNRVTRGVTR